MSLIALLRPYCGAELKALVDLVVIVGPAQVFGEEHSWANKRKMPMHRHEYHSGSKMWQGVLRVTPKSFALFIQSLSHQLKKQIPALRICLTQSELKEHAAFSSMVCWLSESNVAERPALIRDVHRFNEAFVDGEVVLMLELQGLLHDRPPKLSLSEC